MQFNVNELDQTSVYKLMSSTVTPRPIAWVTSMDQHGTLNAAAFSFFNIMGSAPPLAVFNVTPAPDRDRKDTINNILDTGEFVVHLVPENLINAMNITAMNAPKGFNELEAAGLATMPSQKIKVPQIAKAPVAFECVNHATMMTGPQQFMVIGKIIQIRIDDAYMLDREKLYINTPALNLVGRMHGGGYYARSQDMFKLDRINFEAWKKDNP